MASSLTSDSKDDASLPSDDMEDLVRKSRRDILVGGVLYYNNELQSTQKNFQVKIQGTQHQLDTLMRERALGAGNQLEGIVEEMNSTISRLDDESPKVRQSIERVKEDSGDFLYTYRQYSKVKAAQQHQEF